MDLLGTKSIPLYHDLVSDHSNIGKIFPNLKFSFGLSGNNPFVALTTGPRNWSWSTSVVSSLNQIKETSMSLTLEHGEL